ncbi:hypothetical protein G7Y89_g8947 [Cudoniella acicularis]|uniref:Uncharacterized protein n=1 Tax=Cudoniella acicularis TaxID=354080 RepID=A0A8H4RGJ8_9HELO|nr:hypothetical protein G7Y89_g8947 [Cudoniella acicularis]
MIAALFTPKIPATPGKPAIPAKITIASIATGELINLLEKDHELPEDEKVAAAWAAEISGRQLKGGQPLAKKYHAEDSAFYLYEQSLNKHFRAGDKYPSGSLISVYGRYTYNQRVGWKTPCGQEDGVQNSASIMWPGCKKSVAGLIGSAAANQPTKDEDDLEGRRPEEVATDNAKEEKKKKELEEFKERDAKRKKAEEEKQREVKKVNTSHTSSETQQQEENKHGSHGGNTYGGSSSHHSGHRRAVGRILTGVAEAFG